MENEVIQDELRRLMKIIDQRVNADEDFARELAEVAHHCDRDEHHAVARGFLNLSRHHRITGMAGRAESAALDAEYAHVLPRDARPELAGK